MFENLTESSSVKPDIHKTQFGMSVTAPEISKIQTGKPLIGILGSDSTVDPIRSELFKLSDQLNSCQILDFGNLRQNQESQLPFLFEDLFTKNILLIFISSSAKNVIHHIQSVINIRPFTTWMIAHPSLEDGTENNDLIMQSVKDGMMKVKFIGHQAHLTSTYALNQIQTLGIEAMRLGHIRQNIDRVEPWCRSLDHAIFHLDTLRKTDYPKKGSTNPGGFYYEEACKISQFLGASSHLQSMGFYGYQATSDPDLSSAAVVAQLIWYFIDGFVHFREDSSIQKSKLVQYTVHASHTELDINFWKSNETGRWWMEVPGQSDHWVSCTYDDYLEASHGEFSNRLINVLNRV